MLSKLICLWTLCFLSFVILEGEGSPVPKGKANAVKGNAEFESDHYTTSAPTIGRPRLGCFQDGGRGTNILNAPALKKIRLLIG